MIQRIGAKLVLALALFAFADSAFAAPITYNWIGNNGFTGWLTLDTSDFASISGCADCALPASDLTAFSFSGDGVTFDLADIVAGTCVAFDALITPPEVYDGCANLAVNPAGDTVGLYGPNGVDIGLVTGGGEGSTGAWVASSGVPEPNTLVLLGAGLMGIASTLRRKRMKQPGATPFSV